MYEYSEESKPINPRQLPNNVDILLDDTPVQFPYVPRICPHQGYFLIWYGDKDTYPEITDMALACKNEPQSKTCKELEKIEYGQALVYPYEDEVILGTVKYYGYMQNLGQAATKKILKQIWKDIVDMFGHKKIICPTGSFLEWCHLSMNQTRIPRGPYRESTLQSLGFKKQGDFWVR